MNKESKSTIVVLHLIASAGAGGGERFLFDLTQHTDSQIKHLVVMPSGGSFEDRLAPTGIYCRTVDLSSRFSFTVIRDLIRIARQHQAAIIHTHGYRANFIGGIAAIISGAKHVSSVHVSLFDYRQTAWPVRIIYMLFERLVSIFTAQYICVSRAMQKDIVRLGVNPNKTTVISNGVDKSRFYPRNKKRICRHQLGLTSEGPIIGTVGRLVPEKGQYFLIQALRHLRPKWTDLQCVLIGDGPLRDKLEGLANETGLSGVCRFIGIQSNVEDFYQIFDLFVLPSLREPFGIVLLEAMASEVPVVATAAGGVLDFIVPGKNGELVPPQDENALAHKIDRLLSDPVRAKQLAQEGRRSVLNAYTIEKTVDRITDVYLAVTADN